MKSTSRFYYYLKSIRTCTTPPLLTTNFTFNILHALANFVYPNRKSLKFSTLRFIGFLSAIVQQLERKEQISPKAFKRSDEVRYFVLISTLMTWASTKPLSPDESQLPFTEEDYRKRKPHPNFKRHVQCEKDVATARKKIKLRDKLKTLVICCGVTYGDEQGPLHHLFKMAWQNAPFLPIVGKGNNKIPLLHVRDLSR